MLLAIPYWTKWIGSKFRCNELWMAMTGRLKVGGIKLILDGSPQGKTAYLTEPYYKPPHNEARILHGLSALISQLEVSEWVKKYADLNIPIMAHANGDAAADMLIKAIKNAEIKSDHRTIMIHAQTVREDQLDLMKELEIIPSYFSTHTFYWGDWHRDSVFGAGSGYANKSNKIYTR
jgi:predicted amidohydrolase YtcJ